MPFIAGQQPAQPPPNMFPQQGPPAGQGLNVPPYQNPGRGGGPAQRPMGPYPQPPMRPRGGNRYPGPMDIGPMGPQQPSMGPLGVNGYSRGFSSGRGGQMQYTGGPAGPFAQYMAPAPGRGVIPPPQMGPQAGGAGMAAIPPNEGFGDMVRRIQSQPPVMRSMEEDAAANPTSSIFVGSERGIGAGVRRQQELLAMDPYNKGYGGNPNNPMMRQPMPRWGGY